MVRKFILTIIHIWFYIDRHSDEFRSSVLVISLTCCALNPLSQGYLRHLSWWLDWHSDTPRNFGVLFERVRLFHGNSESFGRHDINLLTVLFLMILGVPVKHPHVVAEFLLFNQRLLSRSEAASLERILWLPLLYKVLIDYWHRKRSLHHHILWVVRIPPHTLVFQIVWGAKLV